MASKPTKRPQSPNDLGTEEKVISGILSLLAIIFAGIVLHNLLV